LRAFLQKIEEQYGKADRIWLMDRGIPTEEVLAEMRASVPPIHYLVGTPKGRLTALEAALLPLPWEKVREGVEVNARAAAAGQCADLHLRHQPAKTAESLPP
jgi:hypothetical protein